MISDDFRQGYYAALAFIQVQTSMLRLQYPTNIRKRNSLEKVYKQLISELVEHLKYNERMDEDEEVS